MKDQDKTKEKSGINSFERKIREDEYRKREINSYLKKLIGDYNILHNQIKDDNMCARMMRTPPDGIVVENMDKLMLVRDNVERYPSFDRILYSNMDYQLVTLYVLWFIFLDDIFKHNTMLSLLGVYIVERILRKLR